MFARWMKIGALLCVIVLAGCASAEKRFEQGTESADRGDYEGAVVRYVQALQKDPSFESAKEQLVWAGDKAIEERLTDCDLLLERSDSEGAAGHLQRIDGVVTRARSVGVRLLLPADYESLRRGVFDDAFEAAMSRGEAAVAAGRWSDGVSGFRQARQDYEPDADQSSRAFAAESAALLEWSETEYEHGHLRGAFDIAARIPALQWSPRQDSEAAHAIMQAALDAGEVELIVLPVQPNSTRRKTERGRRPQSAQLHEQVESALEQGPWRMPPPFIRMHEALAARDLIRQSGILDNEYNAATMALILRLSGSDLAVHVQIVDEETTEFGVRRRTETAQTKDGRTVRFDRETGTLRCRATARVVLVDHLGNEIADLAVDGTGEAPFDRGVYDGNPKELNLGKRQVDLFDGIVLDRQEAAARDALVIDLAAGIAEAVYGTTLARVP